MVRWIMRYVLWLTATVILSNTLLHDFTSSCLLYDNFILTHKKMQASSFLPETMAEVAVLSHRFLDFLRTLRAAPL